jgi:hypothetical protein
VGEFPRQYVEVDLRPLGQWEPQVAPEGLTQRLDTGGGRRGQQRLFRTHVSLEELVEGVKNLHEVTGLWERPIRGDEVHQLVGQIAQLYVVGDQLMYPAVREALPGERKEQTFRGDGLVKNLVAQIVHQPTHLVSRPPPLTERGASGSLSTAHLVEQDGVLVGELVLAEPVLVPS